MSYLPKVTRSGVAFSPWEHPRRVIQSFNTLLLYALHHESRVDNDDAEGHTLDPIFATVDSASRSANGSQETMVIDTATSSTPTPFSPKPQAPSPLATAIPASKGRVRSKSQIKTQKLRSKLLRAMSRHLQQSSPADRCPIVTLRHRQKHIQQSTPVDTALSLVDKRVAKTGYVGLRDNAPPQMVYTLSQLVNVSATNTMDLLKWDGIVPTPIYDADGRVVVVLCGHPEDPNWEALHLEAADALETARHRLVISPGGLCHRRGEFPTFAAGISYGGGQTVPGNLVNGVTNAAILTSLMSSTPFVRFAGFATSCFANWAPRLYQYYWGHLSALLQNYPGRLVQNFPNSVFSCATFNFGPKTCFFEHTDHKNLPFGWCSVTALGRFNPKIGGHLILWDLDLVIEFPPGSTILLPSATLRHSNTAIQDDETRYSFTQYTAGGLFRWVDHGFQNETSYRAKLSAKEKVAEKRHMAERWKMGLGLFSTMEELGMNQK